MNQEDKYKEALERARKELQTCGSTDCDAYRLITRLFPELKESEDEKVRKDIIEYISLYKDSITEKEFNSWITWLEKQKPVEWSEEGKRMLNHAVDMVTYCYSNGFVVDSQTSDKVRKWLLEQLPLKKPKWGEVDYNNIEKLIKILPQCIFRHPQILERDKCRDLIDWLKSLKQRITKQD